MEIFVTPTGPTGPATFREVHDHVLDRGVELEFDGKAGRTIQEILQQGTGTVSRIHERGGDVADGSQGTAETESRSTGVATEETFQPDAGEACDTSRVESEPVATDDPLAPLLRREPDPEILGEVSVGSRAIFEQMSGSYRRCVPLRCLRVRDTSED